MNTTGKLGAIALPSDIKRTNRQYVLSILRRGEPVTASSICDETGLSHPTVMKALQEFCEDGIVSSLGYGSTTSRGGKKPEMFIFSDLRELLSISVWPDAIILAHCRLAEAVRDPERIDCRTDIGLEQVINRLRELIADYLKKHHIARGNLYGVAINVPGTVNSESKTINFNVKAPQWGKRIPIVERIRDMFEPDTVFFVDNAGKACGRALLSDTPEYGDQRLLTVFASWGVSACLIDRGHVLNGRDSLIGEVGHMIVSDSSIETCACGKRGCLESMVCMDRIRTLLKERGVNVGADFTFRELFERSERGDIDCRAMSTYIAHYFAVALHNLTLTYNPEVVVFQGDFAWADEAFDRELKRELSGFVYTVGRDMMLIDYDRRDIALLASQGDTDRLKNEYFRKEALREGR